MALANNTKTVTNVYKNSLEKNASKSLPSTVLSRGPVVFNVQMDKIHANEHYVSAMPSSLTNTLVTLTSLISSIIRLNLTGTQKQTAQLHQVAAQTIHNAVQIVTKQAPLFYTMLIIKNVVMMDRSGQLASAKLFILCVLVYFIWP